MKKTYRSVFIIVNLILFLILSLINSNYTINNILDYSKLFLTRLFPVSFLFFIISYLLIEYGLVEIIMYYLNINISGLYVFILSLISGFPSGSKYTKDLLKKNIISVSDANRIILYSHFPNPLFVLGSVNYIVNDYIISLKILFSIIISNFILFIFNKSSNTKIEYNNCNKNFSNILSNAINDSFKTIILIYGTSLFFYLISSFITKYITFNPFQYVFISGIFDLTKGVFSTYIFNDINIRILFILFFISFGSLSIHMQVKSILENSGISYKRFLLGRVIGTIISFILFFIIKNI